jgi:hypothetical protein
MPKYRSFQLDTEEICKMNDKVYKLLKKALGVCPKMEVNSLNKPLENLFYLSNLSA